MSGLPGVKVGPGWDKPSKSRSGVSKARRRFAVKRGWVAVCAGMGKQHLESTCLAVADEDLPTTLAACVAMGASMAAAHIASR